VPNADSLHEEAIAVFDRHFLEEEGRVVDGCMTDFTDPDPYRGANSSMHAVEDLLAVGDVRRHARPSARVVAPAAARSLLGAAAQLVGR